MSGMVAANGINHEADLGEDTLQLTTDIDVFNPVKTWGPVDTAKWRALQK